MSLPSEQSEVSYVGNSSSAVPYPIPFKFFSSTDIVVIVTDLMGVETTLALTTDYTVSGGDEEAGATGGMTTAVAVPATSTVRILRTVPLTQDTVFTDIGKFPSASVDRSFDKLTMALQQVQRDSDANFERVQPFALVPLATDSETIAGASDEIATSPAGVRAAVDQAAFEAGSYLLSTQAQAQGGTNNTTVMSPLRVAQAMLPEFRCASSEAGILAAVSAATAAGGGIILLPNADITLTAPLPVRSSLIYKGVPMKITYTNGYDGQNNLPPSGDGNGTILRGDGTFNGFEANAVDATVGFNGTGNDTANAALTNCGIEDVALVNFLNGVKIGARCQAGPFYSTFRNIYAFGCVNWGLYFENGIHNSYHRIYSFGCGNGFAIWQSNAQTGNSYLEDIFVQPTTATANAGRQARGISFRARNSAIFGGLDGTRIQCNRFQATPLGGGSFPFGTGITSSALTIGSAEIPVADVTQFILDLPVSVSATTSGFTTRKIYFVRKITGTTSGTIQLSLTVMGAPVLASGTTAINIVSQGFSPLEVVGIASHDTIGAQTPSSNSVVSDGNGYNPDFVTGQPVVVSTTGTCPGLTSGGTYAIIVVSPGVYKFATTAANALAGTAITLSTAWTGTLTVGLTCSMPTNHFTGLDLEANGTAAIIAQNATDNTYVCGGVLRGGSNSDGIQTLVGRNFTGSFYARGNYTTDVDSGDILFTGVRDLSKSLGAVGIGTWRDGVSQIVSNLNSGLLTTNYTAASFKTRYNTGSQFIAKGGSEAEFVYATNSTSLTFVGISAGTIVYNGSAAFSWTLPTVTDANDYESLVGIKFKIMNATGFYGTLNTDGTQQFNRESSHSAENIPAFTTIVVVAVKAADGTLFWQIESKSPDKYLQQLAYSATRSVDFRVSKNVLIGAVTADMTISNPPVTVANFSDVTVEIILDSFASGTRNITWGSAYKFPVAFVQPTVITDGTRRTVVHFQAGSNGAFFALGTNVWY